MNDGAVKPGKVRIVSNLENLDLKWKLIVILRAMFELNLKSII